MQESGRNKSLNTEKTLQPALKPLKTNLVEKINLLWAILFHLNFNRLDSIENC